MKVFLILIAFIASIVSVVGLFLGGINVIQVMFEVGGSYTAAYAGFLMWVIGRFVGSLTLEFVSDY